MKIRPRVRVNVRRPDGGKEAVPETAEGFCAAGRSGGLRGTGTRR